MRESLCTFIKMKCVSVIIAISLLIGSIANATASTSNETDHELSTQNQTSKEVFHPILLECENSDYRTYIQCLKRHKRHHEHHDFTGTSKSCFDDCGIDLCTTTHCVHQCHSKCMKKTKETRQFITQFETVCANDDCTSKESSANAPNITTNIDINNVIHNHVKTETSTTTTARPPLSSPRPPFYPPFFPPIQVVSQITFGAGAMGGCINSQSWPCIQQTQPTSFDCSICINPWYRHQCEVKCCNVSVPSPGAQGATPFVCSRHE